MPANLGLRALGGFSRFSVPQNKQHNIPGPSSGCPMDYPALLGDLLHTLGWSGRYSYVGALFGLFVLFH